MLTSPIYLLLSAPFSFFLLLSAPLASTPQVWLIKRNGSGNGNSTIRSDGDGCCETPLPHLYEYDTATISTMTTVASGVGKCLSLRFSFHLTLTSSHYSQTQNVSFIFLPSLEPDLIHNPSAFLRSHLIGNDEQISVHSDGTEV